MRVMRVLQKLATSEKRSAYFLKIVFCFFTKHSCFSARLYFVGLICPGEVHKLKINTIKYKRIHTECKIRQTAVEKC